MSEDGRPINARGRRVYETHPSAPMQIGEIKIFQTKPECRLRAKEIAVKKDIQPDYLIFHAVSGASNGFQNMPGDSATRKYEHQVGYITCNHGWINHLETFERSLRSAGVGEEARGCGIGTILVELCFLDPKITTVEKENKAIKILPEAVQQLVRLNCHKLVGMTMAAKGTGDNPTAAAHVYFSASI